MKYLLLPVITLAIGCSSRNDITTQLLNEKKAIEDSLQKTKQQESYYSNRAKSEINEGADSLKWSASADSAGYFFRKVVDLKQRLKDVAFSIDSISRMK